MWKLFSLCLLVAMFAAVLVGGSQAEKNTNQVWGDYVEARTASVFAGACHYNGELTTSGRDALLAWKVQQGSWNGVDISGVSALAVITSNANLAERATRQSELFIDEKATHAQATALVDALRTNIALGEIVAIKSSPLNFEREGRAYAVDSPGVATLSVEGMPDDLCCRMPQLVWYEPFATLTQRKVGYTKKASYSGDRIGEPWERSGENSAFYGTFHF